MSTRRSVILALAAVLLVAAAAPAPAAARSGLDRRVDLSVRDAELRDVITFLAREARISVVVAEDVRGKVTAYLEGVRLRDALQAILRAHGLVLVRADGVLLAATQDAHLRWLERERERREAVHGVAHEGAPIVVP